MKIDYDYCNIFIIKSIKLIIFHKYLCEYMFILINHKFFLFFIKVSTTERSVNVETSPKSLRSLAAIFFRILLTILPDLVLGRPSVN